LACEVESADESANDIDAREDDSTYFFYNNNEIDDIDEVKNEYIK